MRCRPCRRGTRSPGCSPRAGSRSDAARQLDRRSPRRPCPVRIRNRCRRSCTRWSARIRPSTRCARWAPDPPGRSGAGRCRAPCSRHSRGPPCTARRCSAPLSRLAPSTDPRSTGSARSRARWYRSERRCLEGAVGVDLALADDVDVVPTAAAARPADRAAGAAGAAAGAPAGPPAAGSPAGRAAVRRGLSATGGREPEQHEQWGAAFHAPAKRKDRARAKRGRNPAGARCASPLPGTCGAAMSGRPPRHAAPWTCPGPGAMLPEACAVCSPSSSAC